MKTLARVILGTIACALALPAFATTIDFSTYGPQGLLAGTAVTIPDNNNGLNANDFFASWGLSVSNVTLGNVQLFSNAAPQNAFYMPAAGNFNFVEQFPTGAQPASYQVDGFNASDFSAWRTGYGSPGSTFLPQATITFYDNGTNIGSVSWSEEFDPGPEQRSFTAPAGDTITSIVVSSNGFGFTGIGAATLTDWNFTPVPEPPALVLLAFSGFVLCAMRARKRAFAKA